jgi:hypothetical protein
VGWNLITVKVAEPGTPSLEFLRERLGLTAQQLDASFGVVPVDPEARLFALMVDDQAAVRLGAFPEVSGPFSNPRIEPFGPPRK